MNFESTIAEKDKIMQLPDACEAPNLLTQKEKPVENIKYAILGFLFGLIFVKAEIISWFRIQEMFRLHSFHMYGVIGSAVLTGAISVYLIKRFSIKTLSGESVILKPKEFNMGQVYGGLIFGLGWALTGACPGPLYAQIGSGFYAITITLVSAIAGTWLYGYFKEKLPN